MGPLSENLAHLVVSGVELYAVGEMDAAQEVDISEWAMIAGLSEEMALMWTFAVAVARSHPDAKELLAAFERTLGEDESDDIPSFGVYHREPSGTDHALLSAGHVTARHPLTLMIARRCVEQGCGS